LKIFLIREHTNRVGTAFVVGLRNCYGIEVLANKPGGRRGLFDLRDDIYTAAVRLGDGLVEIAALAHRLNFLLELLKAPLRLTKAYLRPFVGDNFI